MITGNWVTHEVRVQGERLNLQKSLNVRNHSPTGFNWGYGGSGPAQLALAILLHLGTRDEAEKWYQDFKWDYISKLEQDDFVLPTETVKNWLHIRRKGWGPSERR